MTEAGEEKSKKKMSLNRQKTSKNFKNPEKSIKFSNIRKS